MPLNSIQILKEYFGYDEFRSNQKEIIDSVLNGVDTLALLPTGGGKSVCFQVPALEKEGICIVVAPLIALMKDQVENLKKRGIKAEAIFSGMSSREIDITLDNCIYGKIKFLYVSPERLKTDLFLERFKRMNVNLIAVDEAHCISQWGYDFRPSYLEIAKLRDVFPKIPFLALTATATLPVRKDICDKLDFKKNHKVFTSSFYRENLTYAIVNEEDKYGRLFRVIKKVGGSGIVYVRTRKDTEKLARVLSAMQIDALAYHAGLSADERSRRQDLWKSNKVPLMVATNAFGMGIDKPDVRYVVHLALPDNPEAYFQEAGRGGRDGLDSYAVIIYSSDDGKDLIKRYEISHPTNEYCKKIYGFLASNYQLAHGAGMDETFDFDIVQFCKKNELEILDTFHSIKFLEKEGFLLMSESVNEPSRLKVICDKKVLYKFQIANSAMDNLIKAILRSYGGVFDSFSPINEQLLAGRLNMATSQVMDGLNRLNNQKIIEYFPKKDKPQITFLTERIKIENLRVRGLGTMQREEEDLKRMKAMLAYAENMVDCRSKQLLTYFGEDLSKNCGKCDVCLKKLKKKLNNVSLEGYKKILKTNLSKEQSLDNLIDIMGDEEDGLYAIQCFLDEGFIFRDAEGNYSLNKNP
ncbi:MAG: ATP-dependent DNA helicase RecQ [Sphingobacteriales bacterium]|jgi:ATP-dependent DNA helicase RecQ